MAPNVEFKKFRSKRQFGIELEVNRNVSKRQLYDVVCRADIGHRVEITDLPEGWSESHGDYWHVKFDRSCGWEVASYKGVGIGDINNVGKVAECLGRYGAESDSKCGLHIHADISDFQPYHAGVLYAYWLKIEDMVAQYCPSRRRSNSYCMSLRSKNLINYDFVHPDTIYQMCKPSNLASHDNSDKKVTLNLIGYVNFLKCKTYRRSTAELRLPEGSLLRSDVVNWTKLYLNFVDRCRRLPPPMTLHHAGLGETLQILGLEGKGSFFILDDSLRETKVWFLRRLLRYGNGAQSQCDLLEARTIQNEAFTRLEKMGECWLNRPEKQFSA